MNLQVHCTQCNKSLYQLNRIESTPAEFVVFYTEPADAFDRVQGKQVFCDWACVVNWAANNMVKDKETHDKSSSVPSN